MVSIQNNVFENVANSQENTCAGVSVGYNMNIELLIHLLSLLHGLKQNPSFLHHLGSVLLIS